MKSQKTITIITLILLVTIISVASFGGIYKKKEYKVVNIVPKYVLGMEFKDSRVVNMQVDQTSTTTIYDSEGKEVTNFNETVEYTEENGYKTVDNKINPDEVLNTKNFNKTKSILKNRLKKLGVDQYIINLNKETGNIVLRIPENDKTDSILENVLKTGSFEITDNETNEVLIDTSEVKDSRVVYNSSEDGSTTVYLQVEFNKEGKAKLEEISKIYVAKESEQIDENSEQSSDDNIKYVSVKLSGETVMTTYFGETLSNGMINIQIGSASNTASLSQHVTKAKEYATILNSGVLPIEYEHSSEVSNSKITNEQINIGIYIAIGITAIMVVVLIFKFKLKGIFAGILHIGYIALLLLAVRYFNVKITFEGIGGIILSAIINYVYVYLAFKNFNKDFVRDTSKKVSIYLIPIYIIAIILAFNSSAYIYSLGMTLVWGFITMYVYNLSLTNIGIKTIKG